MSDDWNSEAEIAAVAALYQFRLISALSIEGSAGRLDDNRIENSFVPGIDSSIAKCIIISI